jgi:hypothetical protein
VHIIIIGGGPSGIFAAIKAADAGSHHRVTLLEATDEPLGKVRISGGGRCNVTHNCFDPVELVKKYPRGHKELRGPFSVFQPRDTVAFFLRHGVKLKTEPDGRMFPVTNSSASVVDCLLTAAKSLGVDLRLRERVKTITVTPASQPARFIIGLHNDKTIPCDRVMLASGSSPQGHRLAESVGHTIVACVPSLFTFKIRDERLDDLSGISFNQVHLQLDTGGKRKLSQTGPLLITHWGLSGPAVLKLSAWGARTLSDCRYQAKLIANFVPGHDMESVYHEFLQHKRQNPRKRIVSRPLFDIPKRYWSRATVAAGITDTLLWADIPKAALTALSQQLTAAIFLVTGRGVFKDEFVTAGGVSLKEIDFRSMQSRVCPGLYFGGEILDIDGVTGGFNFQSAWTTGWIAGKNMAGTTIDS